MMKSRVAYGLLALVLPALLAGCGLFDWEEREPWRAQAEAACFSRGLVKLTSLIQEVDAVEGKGTCGLDRPLKVAALADGSIQIGGRPVVMSCPMTAALERWVKDSIMPAAYERYGVPVVEIKTMGTYNCRSRNNVPGARLSEHAFANAFDFSGVVLANGYTVTVKKGWRGPEADRAFLRQIHVGACGPFSTVLGPGSDGMHEDHLHLDLARHNNKGTSRYCRPKIQAPPPASYPPTYQVGPEADVPVASMEPQGWPRVLPQSIEAADAAAGLPPGSVPTQAPAAAPACPPGYVCTPVDPNAALPPPLGMPPLGWQKGPEPVDYGEVTGSLGYTDF
jgi:hypothetical protein